MDEETVGETFCSYMDEVYDVGRKLDDILSEHLTPTYPDRPWAVVGVDGGLANAGISVCVVNHSECEVIDTFYLSTESEGSVIERAVMISQRVREIFQGVEQIDVIAVETMSYPRSSSSSAKLSAGISSIITALKSLLGSPVIEVSPQDAQEIFLQSFDSAEPEYKCNMEEKEKIRLECEAGWMNSLPDVKGKREHVSDSIAVAFSSQYQV